MIVGARNKVQTDCYALVSLSKRRVKNGECLYEVGESVVGYSYRADGRYTSHYLGSDLDAIAKFICSDNNDKMLCNTSDYAIASTMGIYLDVAVEPFLTEIMPYLERYQKR